MRPVMFCYQRPELNGVEFLVRCWAHAVDRPIVALDIEDAASIATVTVDSTPCSVATGLQTAIA